MKTRFLSLSILCSMMGIAIMGSSSCAKNSKKEGCQSCTPIAANKVLIVKMGTIDKSFDLWKNDWRNNKNNYCLLDAKATYSSDELRSTLEDAGFIDQVNVPASSLVGVAYFVDKDLSIESSYTLNKLYLKAAFVYYEDGNKLMVKVFREQDGNISEVKELASETDAVSYNDLERFSAIYFNSESVRISSILITENSKTWDRKGSRNYFSKKVRDYAELTTATKPTGSMHSAEHFGKGCGTPCPRDGRLDCHKRLGTPTCNDLATDCSKSSLQPWNSYAVGQDPRDPMLYAFKDNIMAQSTLGQHFIDDFYYIGTVIKDKMNAIVAKQSFTIIDNKVIPIINKLMNDSESTDIIYNATTRDEMLTYIDNVKALSSDPILLEMLEEVKSNISICTDKTVKAVYDELMAD